ncbi:MAG: hypothetical protein WAK91_01610 [Candidatus Acidiferrales bacterium]
MATCKSLERYAMEHPRAASKDRADSSNGFLKLTMLSGTAALVIGVAERHKTDGQPLDRAGVTYVLQKTDAGWKIAVLVLHDPGGAVSGV